jgi:hypothetical protein
MLGITADSYDSVIRVTSQFSGHLNGWWLNRKTQAAIPSTYDELVAEVRKTTFLPYIQDDAINALLNPTQSNTMSYATYTKQYNDLLRWSRQNLTADVQCVRFINGPYVEEPGEITPSSKGVPNYSGGAAKFPE